jgi:hypothetical protein
LTKGIIDKSTLKTLNEQLNKNTKFDVFGHLKRNGGSNNILVSKKIKNQRPLPQTRKIKDN